MVLYQRLIQDRKRPPPQMPSAEHIAGQLCGDVRPDNAHGYSSTDGHEAWLAPYTALGIQAVIPLF